MELLCINETRKELYIVSFPFVPIIIDTSTLYKRSQEIFKRNDEKLAFRVFIRSLRESK